MHFSWLKSGRTYAFNMMLKFENNEICHIRGEDKRNDMLTEKLRYYFDLTAFFILIMAKNTIKQIIFCVNNAQFDRRTITFLMRVSNNDIIRHDIKMPFNRYGYLCNKLKMFVL